MHVPARPSGRRRTCATRRRRPPRGAPRDARRSASCTAPACPTPRSRPCGRLAPGAGRIAAFVFPPVLSVRVKQRSGGPALECAPAALLSCDLRDQALRAAPLRWADLSVLGPPLSRSPAEHKVPLSAVLVPERF